MALLVKARVFALARGAHPGTSAFGRPWVRRAATFQRERPSFWCEIDDRARVLVLRDEHASYRMPFFMLRESCPSHFDPQTRQRVRSTSALSLDVRPVSVEHSPSAVSVEWSDGHKSSFSIDQLRSLGRLPETRAAEETFWSHDKMEEIFGSTNCPTVPFQRFVSEESALVTWLEALRTYGIVLLKAAPLQQGIVQQVAERFAYVRETHYGEVFQVVSLDNPSHLAYTSTGLAPHTDLNYREASPGIQLLHCIRASAVGGESTYVDGFAAAQRLKAESLRDFEILTSVPLSFRLEDQRASHFNTVPAIVMDPTNRFIKEVHWNERTRMPVSLLRPFIMTYPSEGQPTSVAVSVEQVYSALLHFDRILSDPSMTMEFRLSPGDVVAFNNRRVLHGRKAFEVNSRGGSNTALSSYARHLEGCYVEYDEFLSALRLRDLI